jgi:hypothetical protein
MKASTNFFKLAIASSIALMSATASAEIYQFQFSANPDALEATQDKALDVLHTVTIDSSKFTQFNVSTLDATESWLNGGIQMTMSHQGKTVRLNDGLDVTSIIVSIPGAYYPEGFIDLSSNSVGFFALEFAPQSPFIDGNNLPYDPFVYGFLFAYQESSAYKDFRSLWVNGNTSVLPSYQISAVPEPSALALASFGLIGYLAAARRKRASA